MISHFVRSTFIGWILEISIFIGCPFVHIFLFVGVMRHPYYFFEPFSLSFKGQGQLLKERKRGCRNGCDLLFGFKKQGWTVQKKILTNCNLEVDHLSSYTHLERKLMLALKDITGYLILGRCTNSITIRDQSLKKAYAIGWGWIPGNDQLKMAGKQGQFDIVCKYWILTLAYIFYWFVFVNGISQQLYWWFVCIIVPLQRKWKKSGRWENF